MGILVLDLGPLVPVRARRRAADPKSGWRMPWLEGQSQAKLGERIQNGFLSLQPALLANEEVVLV
jgi:hypothetical protein